MAFESNTKRVKSEYEGEKYDMVRNIHEICKNESESGLQVDIKDVQGRVMNYTNLPLSSLLEIIKKRENYYGHLDLFDRVVISDTIKGFYMERKSFTLKDIYEKIKFRMKVPDFTQFCDFMRLLGYEQKLTTAKNNYGTIVMEDPKLTFERYRYLKKMSMYRTKCKTIYYVDERIIDNSLTYKKSWTQSASGTDGYIFFHVVSRMQGFRTGLFCHQVKPEDFSKWISDIVLTFLQPSSVVVMDQSPLHGKPISAPITEYHSVDEMLKWLKDNNIPCTSTMRKAELYDLIDRCTMKRQCEYEIDHILKAHGHEVLRLPKNYHDLSPTELVWEHVINKETIKASDANDLVMLKAKVYDVITHIPSDKWHQFESAIEATEKNIFEIDEVTEKALMAYDLCQQNE